MALKTAIVRLTKEMPPKGRPKGSGKAAATAAAEAAARHAAARAATGAKPSKYAVSSLAWLAIAEAGGFELDSPKMKRMTISLRLLAEGYSASVLDISDGDLDGHAAAGGAKTELDRLHRSCDEYWSRVLREMSEQQAIMIAASVASERVRSAGLSLFFATGTTHKDANSSVFLCAPCHVSEV